MTSIQSSIFLVAKQLNRTMVEKPPPTNRNQKKLQNPNSHLTRKRKQRNLRKKRRKKTNLRRKKRNLMKKRRKMTNLMKKRRKMTNLRKKRRKMTNLRKKRRKKANLRKKKRKRKRKIRKLLLRGKVVLLQTNFLGASRQ
jgi:hypothetical protein